MLVDVQSLTVRYFSLSVRYQKNLNVLIDQNDKARILMSNRFQAILKFCQPTVCSHGSQGLVEA